MAKRGRMASPIAFANVTQTLLVSEAAFMWGVHHMTVRYWITMDYVGWRAAGTGGHTTYLIDYQSVVDHYGEPLYQFVQPPQQKFA